MIIHDNPAMSYLAKSLLVFITILLSGCGSDTSAVHLVCAGDAQTQIGGPFRLLDETGQEVDETVLQGRYALIYFGFTYCPVICPTELQKISAAVKILEADGKPLDKLQPAFFSVDPERDTPEIMARYLTLYHPSFKGFTGSVDQVAEAAAAYRVYYAKEGEGEDYTINHSSIILLMDRQGYFMELFTEQDGADAIAARVGPCL